MDMNKNNQIEVLTGDRNYLYLKVNPHLNENVLHFHMIFQVLTRHQQCTCYLYIQSIGKDHRSDEANTIIP